MAKLLIAGLAGLTALFIQAFGGAVEGWLFPVTDHARILRIERAGPVRVRIWGRATRLRSCSFQRLEWRLGTPRAHSLVDVDFEEAAKVRGDGRFDFGPWVLHLTPDQLYKRSHAVAFHRCHAFWLTETHFFR